MGNSERVLVVDDNPEDLASFVTVLREDGFQVESAPSGLPACDLLAKGRYDLVITDLVMPGASGFDVLRAARKSDPETISIALTSFGSLDSAVDALNLGAYSYLLKPCEPAALRHCIERGLEKQRLAKELRASNQQLQALNRELDAKVQDATRHLQELNRRVLTEMASLKEVDELKTAFLNNVTHDLRNPATTIRGYISYFLQNPDSGISGEVRTCLERVNNAAEHLDRLIEQLLEAAKLDSRKIQLQWQAVDVPGLVKEAAEMLYPQAAKAGVRLETHCEGGGAFSVQGDRGRLLQVLGNLIGNAAKFTPSGGAITVSARDLGPVARLCVEDTGPGIAAEHLPRLFERFYQVQSSRTRQFKGLGLGLRIAKDLVELHRGKIWVESEPGKGSRFFFEVPKEGTPPA